MLARALLPALTAIVCMFAAADLANTDAGLIFRNRERPIARAVLRAPARAVQAVAEVQPVRRVAGAAARGVVVVAENRPVAKLAGRVVFGRAAGACPAGNCGATSSCATGVCKPAAASPPTASPPQAADQGHEAAEAAFMVEPQFDGFSNAAGRESIRQRFKDRTLDRVAEIVSNRPDLRKRIAAYGEARGMGKIDWQNVDQVLAVLVKYFTELMPLILQILAAF